MQAVAINRTRGMDYKLRRKLKPGSDFGLARFATVQRNARLQKFRTCLTMYRSIDNTATQQRAVRRIHDGIDFKLGNITLDNFNIDHENLH